MNIMPRESLSHVMANTLRQRQMMGRFHRGKSNTEPVYEGTPTIIS